jgi:hypothetical protein
MAQRQERNQPAARDEVRITAMLSAAACCCTTAAIALSISLSLPARTTTISSPSRRAAICEDWMTFCKMPGLFGFKKFQIGSRARARSKNYAYQNWSARS